MKKYINAETLNKTTMEARDKMNERTFNKTLKITNAVCAYLAHKAKRGHYIASVWVNPIIQRHYCGVLTMVRSRGLNVKENGNIWTISWNIVD